LNAGTAFNSQKINEGHFFIFDVPSWVAANKGQKNVVIPTHVRVLDVIFYVSFLPFLTLMRLWAF
jgi:hypothetical protein